MIRHNHKTDLQIYRLIFNVYFDVLQTMERRTDFEIESIKDEKNLCRPRAYGKLPPEYLESFDKANIKSEQITLSAGYFSCSFPLHEVIKYKRIYERKLVTPRHHLYFTKVINESEQAA